MIIFFVIMDGWEKYYISLLWIFVLVAKLVDGDLHENLCFTMVDAIFTENVG